MSTQDYETIDRYLDGEMDAAEKAAFEERLRQDETLRHEVSLYKDISNVLQSKLHPDQQEQDLRNTLSALNAEYFKPQAKVVSFKRSRWFAVAAAAAVMIVAVMIWSPWKQDLYHQYAAIEMSTVADRGTAEDTLLKKATAAFNEKKFGAALPALEALVKADSSNAYTRFYYSIALLEENQGGRARQELTQLYNGTSIFRYDAAFYIALSYLKENNRSACKEWLQKIPADASINSKAQKLLHEL